LDTLIELLISEPKLTEEFGVSQGTIRRALVTWCYRGRWSGTRVGVPRSRSTPHLGFFISFAVMGCVNYPRARP